jgi:hypothetical protein
MSNNQEVQTNLHRRKFILFTLLHATVCFLVAIGTIIILNGSHSRDYSFIEKALRVTIALIYIFSNAYVFGLFIFRYFSKYIDLNLMGTISIFVSPLWLLCAVQLYKFLLV